MIPTQPLRTDPVITIPRSLPNFLFRRITSGMYSVQNGDDTCISNLGSVIIDNKIYATSIEWSIYDT